MVCGSSNKRKSMLMKDSGYLPAEHIETPTERLARLNKHRNIDVGVLTTSLSLQTVTKGKDLH